VRELVVLLVLLCAGRAWACDCPHSSLSEHSVREASSIVVVRVVSTAINVDHADAFDSRLATAGIKESYVLRGKSLDKESFVYSYSRCCGVRLEVGGYYALFVTDEHPLEAKSIAYLGDSDWGRIGRRNLESSVSMVRDGVDVERAFRWMGEAISRPNPISPPPPPPCGNVE